MSSTRCALGFGVLVVLLLAGACGASPVDEANRLLDDVLERYVELFGELGAENAEYTHAYLLSRPCQDMDIPQWSDPGSGIPVASREQAQEIADQLSEISSRCSVNSTAFSVVLNSLRETVAAIDPGRTAGLVVELRGLLPSTDPERLAAVLDSAPTRFARFQALLAFLSPTTVIASDGGVMARNFDSYSEARAVRSAAFDAGLAVFAEAADDWEVLQRDWDALEP